MKISKKIDSSAYNYNGNIPAITQKRLVNEATLALVRVRTNLFMRMCSLEYDWADMIIIVHNILNLPEQITVIVKETISYQYDASGNKLSKTVNETGQGQKITTYLGGMIFENNVLQHIATAEGRLRSNGSAFTADYFLKDHLGNVRSMINENGTLLEETHYYPFGLTMKGISTGATGILHNKEKTFQNQQIDEDLDLNWVQFKYRNHDPQIGRFIEVDPLSDKYVHNSTYAFSENKVTAHVELEGLESIAYPLPGQKTLPLPKIKYPGILGAAQSLVERVDDIMENPEKYQNTGLGQVVLRRKNVAKGYMIMNKMAELIYVMGEELKEGLVNENSQLEKLNNTYEKRIQEHEQKLEDYKNDPDKFDNKKVLEGKSPEQRDKIIAGRVKKLEKEIQKFKDNINKNNQKIEGNNKVIEAIDKIN